ncbi:hypothetical protein G7Z17_g7014 [Cylindrodendrum hubeiense]|uniref:Uncharacterized protein n=1 Tax=Cylindrodendrum hubeiense TaxID=595255 RepID=A0A9P5H9V3_9HYPO|nr:hypothetical protein G7Z17_g7014 [Cylindrodendrum hubeiense]
MPAPFSDLPPWTPEQVEECQVWAVKYQAVTWLFILLLAVYGIVQMALFIAVLVDFYDTRQNISTSEFSGTRWSLPVGQCSVELSFHWGPPRAYAPQEKSKAVEGTQGAE